MKTIGIAGTQERIGTTTQALQMVLCLQELEYDSTYVEMGKRHYIEQLSDVYKEFKKDKKLQCWTYQQLQMYTSDQILTVNKMNYDYVIKDYGNINSPDFEKISFLEQDIKIIVAGVKVNEIVHTENILLEESYQDVRYILSFVASDEQKDVRASMGDKSQDTYFSTYIPNPFVYVSSDIYAYLLGE